MRHWLVVAVMVGQPVCWVGGLVTEPWSPVAATGLMLGRGQYELGRVRGMQRGDGDVLT